MSGIGSALRFAGDTPVLRRHALDDDLDVLLGRAARLVERIGEGLDHLRHGLLGDAAVVELDLDHGHGRLLSLWTCRAYGGRPGGGESWARGPPAPAGVGFPPNLG